MTLTETLLPRYLRYIFRDDSDEAHLSRLEEWREGLRAGTRALDHYFLTLDTSGEVTGAAFLFACGGKAYALSLPSRVSLDPQVRAQDVAVVIREAVAQADQLQADPLDFRLVEVQHLLPLESLLVELGFRLSHRRIEFSAPVATLPTEAGTPLWWMPLSPAGPFTLDFAAELLERAGDGDEEWTTAAENREILKAYLADEEYGSSLENIHIGGVAGNVIGLVIAQVIARTGWSRLTYMGLLPEFRGKGYGQWVHRHGFSMLKQYGGVQYVGGTTVGNHAMEALFRKHGCTELRTMQQWQRRR